KSFLYLWELVQTVQKENVTGFPMVPTLAAMLLRLDLARLSLPRLRFMTNAAGALPTAHIRQLRRAFPHVLLYSMYGLTECARASFLPPEMIDTRPESVGRGMPNVEVYIVDRAGRRVGPGVVGELVVRGANVMKGYWNLPEETDRALRPGDFPGST